MPTSTYTVTGNDVRPLRECRAKRGRAIPGVESVEVDLASGRVRSRARAPLTLPTSLAAVDEAGYQAAPK